MSRADAVEQAALGGRLGIREPRPLRGMLLVATGRQSAEPRWSDTRDQRHLLEAQATSKTKVVPLVQPRRRSERGARAACLEVELVVALR